MKQMKIGYFADGPWSHNALEKMMKNKSLSIQFICTRFDTDDQKLKEYSKSLNVPHFTSENINSECFLNKIEKFSCDLFVSMSFNQIFKKEIINLPRLKSINCHAGKLPFYRGRNILNWALINDEKEFGITVHYIDEGIDTGDIILQRTFPITDNDNYQSLLELSYKECSIILNDALNLFLTDKVKAIQQNHIDPFGFYCSMRKKGDEIINWNQTSRELFNFIRAISSPGPQARGFINGIEMTINAAEQVAGAKNYKGINGAILCKNSSDFLVKVSDNVLKVTDYSFEGKFKVGDRFEIR